MAETDDRRSEAYFLTAPALEATFALGALLWRQRRRFAEAWVAEVEAQLTPEEHELLALLRRLPEHLVLGDLAVHHRCFQDPLALTRILAETDPAEFACRMLGDQITTAELAEYQAASDGPTRLRKRFPWLWAGNEEVLGLLLHEGTAIQQAFVRLLPRIWEVGLKPMLPRLEPLWEATLNQARTEGEGKEPKEYGLTVFPNGFGRRFGPDHLFPQILFVPTFFLSPTRAAFTEFDIALLTLDCRLGPWAVQKARGKIIDGLRAITEPHRLEILRLLAVEKGFGGWVAGRLKLNPATVTHHIAQLRKAGLLTEVEGPPGAAKYYQTDQAALRKLLQQVGEFVDGQFEPE